ncbi:hypothetical protein Vadar_009905 [Vaccinium darrowii]|uniref:Uncharacterized protein n=1 Tax=Vaccinium darrowii TaxID=229202 RepID=A0ACB7YDB4_9ERIC|nr:hypothetical protein Vadar_009905 [Vaccinium darrowii]
MEPENTALRRLSENFDSIFTSNSNSFSDATIAVAGGQKVAVHRCILSARSPFFKTLFSSEEGGVKLELRDLAKDFEVSLDALVTVLVFLYSGKVGSLRPEGVCVCVDDECEHVACRPAVDFVVEVLYASFVFEIPELVALCQRHLLDILDKIAADDILVVLSLANICGYDLRMTSSYLESRVALAKLLFPAEAKVAMDIARVHHTSECAFPIINSTSLAGVQSKDEHLKRIMALFKTVELGKLFFPRCSEVLNDMVDNDLSELVFMPNETQEERQLKKRRYTELKEDITRAFREDKEEFNKFTKIPSSSSSSSISTSIRGVGMPNVLHDKSFLERIYGIFQAQGVTLQLGQLDQRSIDGINNGMNGFSEAENYNLPCPEPLQNGKATRQVDSSDQPPMDPSNNGQNVGTAEGNIIGVTSSKEGTRKGQAREHKQTGVRIDISLEDILKLSEMRRKIAARKLKVSISTLRPSVARIKPALQDGDMVTVKAKYENGVFKFRLTLLSTLAELQQEVAKRLNQEAGTYSFEYKDEEDDLITIACDEDLQDCIRTSRSLGKASIVVQFKPKQPSTHS